MQVIKSSVLLREAHSSCTALLYYRANELPLRKLDHSSIKPSLTWVIILCDSVLGTILLSLQDKH